MRHILEKLSVLLKVDFMAIVCLAELPQLYSAQHNVQSTDNAKLLFQESYVILRWASFKTAVLICFSTFSKDTLECM